jgi:hypothetical protein
MFILNKFHFTQSRGENVCACVINKLFLLRIFVRIATRSWTLTHGLVYKQLKYHCADIRKESLSINFKIREISTSWWFHKTLRAVKRSDITDNIKNSLWGRRCFFRRAHEHINWQINFPNRLCTLWN